MAKSKKKRKAKPCSCGGKCDPCKMAEATKAIDHEALKARASKLTKNKQGKLVSKRSKTQDAACSQAMSQWKTSGMTPTVAATLGKCRAKARLLREGATRREMGQEARAQAMESRASRGGPMTAKDRLAKAKQLRAERANREPSVLAPRPGEDDVRRRFRESNAKPTPAAGRNTPARLALARAKRADRAASREPGVLSGSANEAAVRQSFRDSGLDRTVGSAPKRAKSPARAAAPQPTRTTDQPAPGSYAERARKRRADRHKEAAAVAPMPPGSERLPIRDSIAPAASQEERRRNYAARDDAAYNLRALRAYRQYKEAQRASRTVATPAPTAAALRTTVTSTPTAAGRGTAERLARANAIRVARAGVTTPSATLNREIRSDPVREARERATRIRAGVASLKQDYGTNLTDSGKVRKGREQRAAQAEAAYRREQDLLRKVDQSAAKYGVDVGETPRQIYEPYMPRTRLRAIQQANAFSPAARAYAERGGQPPVTRTRDVESRPSTPTVREQADRARQAKGSMMDRLEARSRKMRSTYDQARSDYQAYSAFDSRDPRAISAREKLNRIAAKVPRLREIQSRATPQPAPAKPSADPKQVRADRLKRFMESKRGQAIASDVTSKSGKVNYAKLQKARDESAPILRHSRMKKAELAKRDKERQEEAAKLRAEYAGKRRRGEKNVQILKDYLAKGGEVYSPSYTRAIRYTKPDQIRGVDDFGNLVALDGGRSGKTVTHLGTSEAVFRPARLARARALRARRKSG
jgi:hypothetical protein